MSKVSPGRPRGAIKNRWSSQVDDYVIACNWALDGKALLVSDAAGSIHAFNGRSGAPLWRKIDNHGGHLLAMSIHSNGKSLATAGQDGNVLLWSIQEGEVYASIDLGDRWVEHITWSSDGEWLAIASSRDIYVFDELRRELWRTNSHPSTVSAIAWSSGGDLAAACYGTVSFYDVGAQELKQKLEWKGSLVSMVLSPNGDIVACGSQDNSVHFWRRSRAEDSMMAGYSGKPSNLAFDQSGMLLATGGSNNGTVWSFADGGPEGTTPGFLELHSEPISSLAFSPRGMRLASGARDGSIIVWGVQRNGEGDAIGAVLMKGLISAIAWRPDGRVLATANANGGIAAWGIGN